MQRNLYKSLLVIVLISLVFPVMAQMRRVRMCANNRVQSSYVEAYEYDQVDEQPQFPGGERGLVNYINQTREYPYEAYAAGIEGRVLCSFVINTDGSVSNITVLRGCNKLLNDEAVRVISSMPRWKAGKVDSKPVPVYYMLPIVFRL